jgi:hypothetical protein
MAPSRVYAFFCLISRRPHHVYDEPYILNAALYQDVRRFIGVPDAYWVAGRYDYRPVRRRGRGTHGVADARRGINYEAVVIPRKSAAQLLHALRLELERRPPRAGPAVSRAQGYRSRLWPLSARSGPRVRRQDRIRPCPLPKASGRASSGRRRRRQAKLFCPVRRARLRNLPKR